MKTNMIIGKLKKPVLQNQIADKTTNLVGGDIMDFNKIVKEIQDPYKIRKTMKTSNSYINLAKLFSILML